MLWLLCFLVSLAFALVLAIGISVGIALVYIYNIVKDLKPQRLDEVDEDIVTLAVAVKELQQNQDAMVDAFHDIAILEAEEVGDENDPNRPITMEDLILARPHPECFNDAGEPITDEEYIAYVMDPFFGYDQEETF